MFCLKCQRHTQTLQEYITHTKNGRRLKKGLCAVCGRIKNVFMKNLKQFGSSLLNKALNALPLPEMHLKSAVGAEQVPNGSFNNTGKYSFCGPFTKLRQRTAEGYKGVNPLDKACMSHDIAYSTHSDTQSRNKSDDVLAAQASQIVLDENTPDYEKKDAKLVNAIMAAKSRFGLGLKIKNSK